MPTDPKCLLCAARVRLTLHQQERQEKNSYVLQQSLRCRGHHKEHASDAFTVNRVCWTQSVLALGQGRLAIRSSLSLVQVSVLRAWGEPLEPKSASIFNSRHSDFYIPVTSVQGSLRRLNADRSLIRIPWAGPSPGRSVRSSAQMSHQNISLLGTYDIENATWWSMTSLPWKLDSGRRHRGCRLHLCRVWLL